MKIDNRELYISFKEAEKSLKTIDDIKKYNLVIDFIKEYIPPNNPVRIKIDRIPTATSLMIDRIGVADSDISYLFEFNFSTGEVTYKTPTKVFLQSFLNTDGLLKGKILNTTEIIEKVPAFEKYRNELPGYMSAIIYKEYEKNIFVKGIILYGSEVIMTFNCENGDIKIYSELYGDYSLVKYYGNDKDLIQPSPLDEIFENMRKHKTQIKSHSFIQDER